MKTILVDLGNTALKWAVLGNEHEPHTVYIEERLNRFMIFMKCGSVKHLMLF